MNKPNLIPSQSLWVRDRFLMRASNSSTAALCVAIPLGQGQVFNIDFNQQSGSVFVAIPLGQGQVFNSGRMGCRMNNHVAIPLGQGQVFNKLRA